MSKEEKGAHNLDRILPISGVDVVLKEAVDLFQSCGIPGQAEHPVVHAAVEKISDDYHHHSVKVYEIPRTGT